MSILKLIASDNYIPVNRDLIKIFGLEEAVLLGELCNQYGYWEKENKLIDGMFYCSASKLTERTGLSEYQQRQALQSLKNSAVIETGLKGCPATKYFKINEPQLLSFLITSSEKTQELVPKKLQLSNNINNKNIINKQSISKDIDCTEKFHFGKSLSTEIKTNEVNSFKALYDEYCFNLPKISKLTDSRIKAIKKILKKYNREEIITVLTNANNSAFLTGNNDRGWKANIDFILREDKFVNILEGKYNSKVKISRQVSSDMGRHNKVMTDDQKKQFKEDIASGKAEKF